VQMKCRTVLGGTHNRASRDLRLLPIGATRHSQQSPSAAFKQLSNSLVSG
jgi:hypothetical protein